MKSGLGLPASSRALTLQGPFQLEHGAVLPSLTLGFNTYGTLAPDGRNCVVVGHSLTSNSCVHEWWAPLLGAGPGFLLDTERYFIVCANYLGSVYGSSSPLSADPRRQDGAPFSSDFPVTTLKDNVRAQAALLRQLGVAQLAMAVGGSLGGMLALEWAAEFPGQVDSLCLIATCAQHPGWAIGLNEAARQAIYADPLWASGAYGRSAASAAPLAGMAVARQFAMLSYRTPASLDSKFGRATKAQQRPEGLVRAQGLGAQGQGQGRTAAAPPFFEVESYLNYQGEKFRERFDPLAYVRLTQLMDSHDLGRGRAVPYRQVLASMQQRALSVGIDSDLLYPVSGHLCAHAPHLPSPLTSHLSYLSSLPSSADWAAEGAAQLHASLLHVHSVLSSWP